MPTYVYETIPEPVEEPQRFEVVQKMSDPPARCHPTTGVPARRVMCAPFIGGRWSEARARGGLQDSQAASLGVSKYVNAGDGVFEKAYGDGPDTLPR